MGFSIVHTDHSPQPWETMVAAPGQYKVGQALHLNNGKLEAISPALTTVPPYISMSNRTCEEGETLPVIRVTEDTVFEAPLTAISAGAKPGAMLQVSDGGLGVNGTAPGAFEVMSAEGTAVGNKVTGRFVAAPAAP